MKEEETLLSIFEERFDLLSNKFIKAAFTEFEHTVGDRKYRVTIESATVRRDPQSITQEPQGPGPK